MDEVFQNPICPFESVSGDGYTLQIASPLPDRVPIGHFEIDCIEPVVDEVVTRSEYCDRIQQGCSMLGERYTVRFYRHEDGFDASILDGLDQIRSLQIDPVREVANAEAVGRLPHLVRLTFAPRGKTRSDVLDAMRVQRLSHFTLADTSTPPVDLAPLGEATSLRTLRLLGQGKNIVAVGRCTSLLELSMQPQEAHPIEVVSVLPRLESLKFSLGKRRTITAIEAAPALRDLSFHLVSTLEDLGDLQRFPRLRRLQIEQQKRLRSIRVGPRNAALEHIAAESLEAIDGLTQLPALKSLFVFDGKMDVDWSALPPTLTHLTLMPRSMKARARHSAEVRARGLIPEPHPDATFFYK